MKPHGLRRGAWEEYWGKAVVDGRKRWTGWCDWVAKSSRGRLFDRRVIEEQMGAKRPARMR